MTNCVYQLSQEERIRMECEAREDYLRTQRGIQNRLSKLDKAEGKIKAQENEISRLHAWIRSQGYDPANI